ncbi:MAG: Ig-like domain-containing protein, partial [Candidatus Woesearchaeota archaeon]
EPDSQDLIFGYMPIDRIAVSLNGAIAVLAPQQDWNGNAKIIFTASDGINSTESNEVFLEIAAVNDIPMIISNPNSTAFEDALYTYEVLATDIDGDDIEYSLEKAPASMTMSDNVISWTPLDNQVGANEVVVIASDGDEMAKQSFTIVVINTEDAPVARDMPNQNFDEDTTYCMDISEYISDPDGDKLTYSVATEHHVSAAIEGSTLCIVPETDWSGAAKVTIIATDGKFTAEASFEAVVEPVNDAPIITSTPQSEALEDGDYTYEIAAYDKEDDPISFSLAESPTGMVLKGNVISWSPSDTQIGKNTVLVIASDGKDIGEQLFTIFVHNTNDAPYLVKEIPALAWDEDTVYELDLTDYIADPDMEELEYSGSAQNMIIEFAQDKALITPAKDWNGVGSAKITAKDTGLSVETNEFDLIVRPVNDAPVLSVSDLVVEEGQLAKIIAFAIDVENDQLTFFYSSPFSSLGEWQTGFTDSGVYATEVKVSDGKLFDSRIVKVTVKDSQNHAPELMHMPDVRVVEGDIVHIMPIATDLDGDSIVFKFQKPLDQDGKWQTGFTDEGFYKVLVVAEDGRGGNASQEVTITVENSPDNHAPNLFHIGDISVRAGELVSIKPVAADPDGDGLSISISAPVGNDGYWQTAKKDEGDYKVTVTACDTSACASQVVLVSVGEAAYQELFVENIRFNEVARAGDTVLITVNFENSGNIEMKGVKVNALVLDLAISDSAGPFKLHAGQSVSKELYLYIPPETRPGVYDIRFTINNANERRVKHRAIVVV